MEFAILPDQSVYTLGDDGLWHHIPDPETADSLGIDWNAIPMYDQLPGDMGGELSSVAATSTATLVAQQPTSVGSTYGIGSLVGLPDQRVLMLGADGQWHWIPDVTTFNTLQLQWSAVSWLPGLPGSEGVPLASAAAAATLGDWQSSDDFQAPPPPTSSVPQPVPAPTSPSTANEMVAPQPTAGEATPGDWTTADIVPLGPSPSGTPIPGGGDGSTAAMPGLATVFSLAEPNTQRPPAEGERIASENWGRDWQIRTATDTGRIEVAYYYFIANLGLSSQAAAGLVGNLAYESTNFNAPGSPKLVPSLGEIGGGGGIGIAQWTDDTRKRRLFNAADQRGLPWQDFRLQLDYVVEELKGPFKSVLQDLRKATTVSEATQIIEQDYEHPQDWTQVGPTAPSRASYWGRLNEAESISERFNP